MVDTTASTERAFAVRFILPRDKLCSTRDVSWQWTGKARLHLSATEILIEGRRHRLL